MTDTELAGREVLDNARCETCGGLPLDVRIELPSIVAVTLLMSDAIYPCLCHHGLVPRPAAGYVVPPGVVVKWGSDA